MLILLWKCYFRAKIDGNLLLWIEDYMEHRRQRVGVNGVKSEWEETRGGTDEGTAIAPLLFLIYCIDIGDFLPVKIAMFADDITLWSERPLLTDAFREINLALHLLQQWSNGSRVDFSPPKCKFMIIRSS